MPRPTGFEICQEMKSKPETRLIPVILLTSLNSDADRIHGIMCGADDFLNKPVNKHELLARAHSLLRLKQFTDELDNAETVLFSLALSIEAKDPYTEGHCDRLSKYSVAVGEKLGLPQDLRVALRRGGLVHDIGKLSVPEHILLKPGPLTPEERKIMERHTVIGEKICAPLRSFRHVLPIILFMVVANDGQHVAEGPERGANFFTYHCVSLHDFSLFRSQRSGFEQDLLCHGQLTDIVNETAPAQSDAQFLGQPEFISQRDGIFRRAVSVPFGIGVLRLDTQCEAEQYGFSVVQLIGELLQAQQGMHASQ